MVRPMSNMNEKLTGLSGPIQTTISVAFVGKFNPSIFHPAWFREHDMVDLMEGDLEEAVDSTVPTETKVSKNIVILDDLSTFTLGFLRISVERNRFVAVLTHHALTDELLDFLTRTFSILEHTPISAFGINVQSHYQSTVEFNNNLFSKAAPSSFWDRAKLNGSGRWDDLVTIQRLWIRDVDYKGRTDRMQVDFQPSKEIKNGVFISTNDHYEIGLQSEINSKKALDRLNEVWNDSFSDSKNVFSSLLNNEGL